MEENLFKWKHFESDFIILCVSMETEIPFVI